MKRIVGRGMPFNNRILLVVPLVPLALVNCHLLNTQTHEDGCSKAFLRSAILAFVRTRICIILHSYEQIRREDVTRFDQSGIKMGFGLSAGIEFLTSCKMFIEYSVPLLVPHSDTFAHLPSITNSELEHDGLSSFLGGYLRNSSRLTVLLPAECLVGIMTNRILLFFEGSPTVQPHFYTLPVRWISTRIAVRMFRGWLSFYRNRVYMYC